MSSYYSLKNSICFSILGLLLANFNAMAATENEIDSASLKNRNENQQSIDPVSYFRTKYKSMPVLPLRKVENSQNEVLGKKIAILYLGTPAKSLIIEGIFQGLKVGEGYIVDGEYVRRWVRYVVNLSSGKQMLLDPEKIFEMRIGIGPFLTLAEFNWKYRDWYSPSTLMKEELASYKGATVALMRHYSLFDQGVALEGVIENAYTQNHIEDGGLWSVNTILKIRNKDGGVETVPYRDGELKVKFGEIEVIN